MLFPPPFPQLVQPPAKARRHHLPFSLSEWDVRMRRIDHDDHHSKDGGGDRGRRSMAMIRRSRSWISNTDHRSVPGTSVAAISADAKQRQAADTASAAADDDDANNAFGANEDANANDASSEDASSSSAHTVGGGRSSFYQRFCNSLTLHRSSDRRRRPGGGSTASAATAATAPAEEAADGAKAEDATSLDTWLSRRRHRRRDGFTLTTAATPAVESEEGNGNSRIGRLVSSSLGKIRGVFSVPTRCGSGTKTTAGEEKEEREGWSSAPVPEGTRRDEQERHRGSAPVPEGTDEQERHEWTAPVPERYAPLRDDQEWHMAPVPEGTRREEDQEGPKWSVPSAEKRQHNINLSRRPLAALSDHCRWLRCQMMLIECDGNEQQQNGQGNGHRENGEGGEAADG